MLNHFIFCFFLYHLNLFFTATTIGANAHHYTTLATLQIGLVRRAQKRMIYKAKGNSINCYSSTFQRCECIKRRKLSRVHETGQKGKTLKLRASENSPDILHKDSNNKHQNKDTKTKGSKENKHTSQNARISAIAIHSPQAVLLYMFSRYSAQLSVKHFLSDTVGKTAGEPTNCNHTAQVN